MRPDTERLPIIMLTARGEESDRVRGLSTGADDYLVKPFSTPEFMARVKALLRRAKPEVLSSVLKVGDIMLDRESHRVYRKKSEIKLGPTEFRLLEFMMRHPGRVFSRSQLLDNVWGETIYIDERTVDVHVGQPAQGAQLLEHAGCHPHRTRRRILHGSLRGFITCRKRKTGPQRPVFLCSLSGFPDHATRLAALRRSLTGW
jgi:DNA-binding response OmpR family regulator